MPTTYRRLTCGAVSLAAATALALAVPGASAPAGATSPGKPGRIVFSSNDTGRFHVYTVNRNGTGLRQLTHGSGEEVTAAFSPDGRHIAYAENLTGARYELYLMNADGTHQHRISHDGGTDWMPSWSPDGRHIAFEHYQSGQERIAVVDADGTHEHYLTPGLAFDGRPAWSPDGRHIAFSTTRYGTNNQIAIMRTDGSGTTRVTDDSTTDVDPEWSPVGNELTYTATDTVHSDSAIWEVDPTGLAPTQLTFPTSGHYDQSATWSPDGAQILYSTYPSAGSALLALDAYSPSSATPVSTGTTIADDPSWGPVPIRCHGQWATIGGTGTGDLLMGTGGHDVIAARGGDDYVYGMGGNDVICGGGGGDALIGGPGNDVIDGGRGGDSMYGNGGNDRIFARDHHRDPGISCGGGADHATWDRGLDPHPRSC
jgi:TolB protein